VPLAAVAAIAAGLLAPVASLAAGGVKSATSPATSGWRAVQLPLPAGGVQDGAGYAGPIACPVIGRCVILGEYSTASGSDEDLIATQSGSVWSVLKAPLPLGAKQATNLGPYTLTCTGVGNCVGTSLYQSSTSVAADILEEVAGVWSAIAMSLPANASPSRFPTIASIACPLQGSCVIVGTYVTTSGLSEGLVVTEQGEGFVPAEATTPGRSNEGSGLSSVACTAVTACAAVGYFVTTSGRREPLIVNDAAGALTALRAPLPAGAASNPRAELQAVSCGGSTGCVALGAYENAKGDHLGVVDTALGEKWFAAETPSPSGAEAASPSPEIYGVSCRYVTSCLAVGQYKDSFGRKQGLALLEQSGNWSASMMPGTDNTGVVVEAVSCATATRCAAAGHYLRSSHEFGYLMTLSDSTLSGSTSPAPADANPNPAEALGFVACPRIAACTVSGTYDGGSPSVQLPLTLIE